ncbi:DUF6695 family protein [Jejudonia soesokkakensis]|uniref:DUF6695 family protein n=1 Tax=Jejudonia soesokkakensis TaxID=1323432 RepID=A0ABW2MVY9_9FLAO
MNPTGKIIVLAYPDTFVTMSTEFICRLLPLVGLGTKTHIKAGHAALVLIENKTGKMQYFDFGRYVTPPGMGRVRNATTDAELVIPFSAAISSENILQNLDEILLWLDANPQKTHGEGRLLASVCNVIDFELALNYMTKLQKRGSIAYGAFDKTGSNCSRFVTDTILAATTDKKIKKALQFNKRFTPSTVGNVEKAAADKKIFQAYQGEVTQFKSSALKENLKNYFDRNVPESKLYQVKSKIPAQAQKLAGTGSNAWFELVAEEPLPQGYYRIRRYNDLHEIDYDGIYESNRFNLAKKFQFVYDSNCAYCTVVQDSQEIRLKGVKAFSKATTSLQKEQLV